MINLDEDVDVGDIVKYSVDFCDYSGHALCVGYYYLDRNKEPQVTNKLLADGKLTYLVVAPFDNRIIPAEIATDNSYVGGKCALLKSNEFEVVEKHEI